MLVLLLLVLLLLLFDTGKENHVLLPTTTTATANKTAKQMGRPLHAYTFVYYWQLKKKTHTQLTQVLSVLLLCLLSSAKLNQQST